MSSSPITGSWLPDGAVLSDIEFSEQGDLIVGLRNRALDSTTTWTGRAGDLLPSERDGGGWRIVTAHEHYRDQRIDVGSITMGGLAAVPGLDRVVSSAFEPGVGYVRDGVGLFDPNRVTAWWFDNRSGEPLGTLDVYSNKVTVDASGLALGLGDLEALCPRNAQPDAPLVPTATEEIRRRQTATATPPVPPPTRPSGHVELTPASPATLTALATARSFTATAVASRAAGTATSDLSPDCPAQGLRAG